MQAQAVTPTEAKGFLRKSMWIIIGLMFKRDIDRHVAFYIHPSPSEAWARNMTRTVLVVIAWPLIGIIYMGCRMAMSHHDKFGTKK